MILNDLEIQKACFSDPFRNFGLPRIFQQWIAQKLLEVSQDNLRTKFAA